jgi:hypothetical protein
VLPTSKKIVLTFEFMICGSYYEAGRGDLNQEW